MIAIEALQRDRQKVQAELEAECERLGSCRSSWSQRQEFVEWLKEHNIPQDERGWTYTAQDDKDRDTAIKSYERKIAELRESVAGYDKTIMTILSKW